MIDDDEEFKREEIGNKWWMINDHQGGGRMAGDQVLPIRRFCKLCPTACLLSSSHSSLWQIDGSWCFAAPSGSLAWSPAIFKGHTHLSSPLMLDSCSQRSSLPLPSYALLAARGLWVTAIIINELLLQLLVRLSITLPLSRSRCEHPIIQYHRPIIIILLRVAIQTFSTSSLVVDSWLLVAFFNSHWSVLSNYYYQILSIGKFQSWRIQLQ